MRPEIHARIALEAAVSPSEDPRKILGALLNVLGSSGLTVKEARNLIRVESDSVSCLNRVHDQLRERQVRGVARRRLTAGRLGNSTTVLINRQAAAANVLALCDNKEESPLGPVYLIIESERLDELIQWLTDYPGG